MLSTFRWSRYIVEVVVTQLAEQLLPTQEYPGSNPVIGNCFTKNILYSLITVKKKKWREIIAHLKKVGRQYSGYLLFKRPCTNLERQKQDSNPQPGTNIPPPPLMLPFHYNSSWENDESLIIKLSWESASLVVSLYGWPPLWLVWIWPNISKAAEFKPVQPEVSLRVIRSLDTAIHPPMVSVLRST